MYISKDDNDDFFIKKLAFNIDDDAAAIKQNKDQFKKNVKKFNKLLADKSNVKLSFDINRFNANVSPKSQAEMIGDGHYGYVTTIGLNMPGRRPTSQ